MADEVEVAEGVKQGGLDHEMLVQRQLVGLRKKMDEHIASRAVPPLVLSMLRADFESLEGRGAASDLEAVHRYRGGREPDSPQSALRSTLDHPRPALRITFDHPQSALRSAENERVLMRPPSVDRKSVV